MSEKTLNNIRIVHKHDTEENWLKATNFIPKQGELIIYDVDDKHNYERFKIGDGINLVNDLPFGSDWKSLENKPFGSKIVETECLTEITVDFDYDDDESIYYKYFDQNVMSYPLQAGKSYNVIIDGIVYEKLVCYGEEDSFNVKLGGQHDTDFSNYPFSISYNTDSQKLGIYLSKKISESTSTHTIEIIEKDEIINQIDGKYIPQSDLSQNDETAGDYVKGRTHWQDDNYTVWNGCYFSDTDVKENPGWHYIEIEENQKYKVTINNKDKYEGTVLRPYDGYGMHIGNAYLLDYSQNGVYDSDLFPDDTGEPFVIYVDYQSYDEVEGAWQSRLYFYFEDGYTVYDDGLSLYLERTVEGDIHQLDEKFIPDTIARKNDIPKVLEQFQSDMNEMDKYSPAFIKNKTHWYENSPYDYLLMDDDGEVYIQFTSEANVWVKLPDNGYFDIDGELLTVIFDGIKYRLSVVEEWGDEDPYYVLYHDKFEIKYDFYDSNMYIKTVESGEHNINIYRGGEHWNPLDEKYIPDTIARKSDLENIDLSTKADINHTHSFNDLEDKPFYEKTTTTEIVYLDTEHDFTTGGL